jgi:hypothetical protein
MPHSDLWQAACCAATALPELSEAAAEGGLLLLGDALQEAGVVGVGG